MRWLGILSVMLLINCAHLPSEAGDSQSGLASWYGRDHHGKRTASGETFDMNQLTAAHRTLPMNSVVQVKSLTTGNTIQVRINDRGPYGRGRVIDLSYAAAKRLGMINKGMDEVEVRVVSIPR
ncbi:MAG: septal ring lytic transglycosylase RlpA family protein [Bdellovibrionaceae bacterium]|nr:septal ring lytic transglycosylase RlpA family protein [Pseudobdellovibrionaceae bacterium]